MLSAKVILAVGIAIEIGIGIETVPFADPDPENIM